MALGADDATYLQSGLALLWAGDDDEEDAPLGDRYDLSPSSSIGDAHEGFDSKSRGTR